MNDLKQKNRNEMASPSLVRRFLATLAIALFMLVPLASQAATDGGIESLRQSGKAFAEVAKKVSPAVVFIQVEKSVQGPNVQFFSPFGNGGPFGDDFFRHFFGVPKQEGLQEDQPSSGRRVVGQGSGFIISKDGYILTNNHVVGDTEKVTVKLMDGREFTAKTIGTDPHSDVAVIKIDADDLPVLPMGDSDALEVGEWVVAIGNPFGLTHTLTAGVVSAKGRSSIGIADYENFIQTDAAINPGNSGGPLVNLDGEAVGMNTAIFSQSGGYMGIGFAIPINMAKSIKDQLIQTGEVTRGHLGIVIQDLTPDLAKSFGLENQKGILVAQVSKDSPAEKGGMQQGDVIVEFEGKPVNEIGSFRNQVALKAPGTKSKITVLRHGSRKTLNVTVGRLEDGEVASAGISRRIDKLGLSVRDISLDLAEKYNLKDEKGVVVTEVKPGSVAALAGMKTGSVIQEVDRKKIDNAHEFEKTVEATPKDSAVLLLVKEGQYSRYVVLKTE